MLVIIMIFVYLRFAGDVVVASYKLNIINNTHLYTCNFVWIYKYKDLTLSNLTSLQVASEYQRPLTPTHKIIQKTSLISEPKVIKELDSFTECHQRYSTPPHRALKGY